MTTDEEQYQFDSLCVHHERRQWAFSRRIERAQAAERVLRAVSWIIVPISWANVMAVLYSGEQSLLLALATLAGVFTLLPLIAYRMAANKKLRAECAELERSGAIIREWLERNPELASRLR